VHASQPLSVRPAVPADVPLLLEMARGLAVYERLPNAVTATEADLHKHLFGPKPAAEAAIGCVGEVPAGMVVFFNTFSTFVGQPGIYLEDIYVDEPWRGHGLGRVLMQYVAKLSVARGCGRFEWSVLDWNAPAIGFYEKLGARPQADWTMYRLQGEALRQLALEAR
jgi:GNAT superfamily N-acetyltransferase